MRASEAQRQERDRLPAGFEEARNQDAFSTVGDLELGGLVDLGLIDERETLQDIGDVEILERRDRLEERHPTFRGIEPAFPTGIERLLDITL